MRKLSKNTPKKTIANTNKTFPVGTFVSNRTWVFTMVLTLLGSITCGVISLYNIRIIDLMWIENGGELNDKIEAEISKRLKRIKWVNRIAMVMLVIKNLTLFLFILGSIQMFVYTTLGQSIIV